MSLKQDLAAGRPLIGTFVKTPSAIVCEVLTQTELDVVCLDAEHAPFDRGDIDACIHALRCGDMDSLVRIPSCCPEHVQNALDSGATGIVAPHVTDPDAAQELVACARYGRRRGYAGSTRAAFGSSSIGDHVARGNEETVIIAQIEDRQALDVLDDIFMVDHIDAFFIGRADLTASLGADNADDAKVIDAVEKICNAGSKAGVTLGMFTPDAAEIRRWRANGVSLFLLGSDQTFIRAGAADLTGRARCAFQTR